MSQSVSVSGNWQEKLSAACDRLVHPAVTNATERSRHRRLIGVLLAAPFILVGLVSQTLYGAVDNGTLLALSCAMFAASWMGTAVVASMAKTRVAEAALLAIATVVIAGAISVTGLLKSPLVLLLMAPPFECWWLHRSRGPSNKGWWASIAACALALTFMNSGYVVERHFAEHLWILPLLYAVTMWVRFTGPRSASAPEAGEGTEIYEIASEIADGLVLRSSADGDIEFASSSAISIIGVPPALLLGKGLFERIHVTDRVEFLTNLADTRQDGQRRCGEFRVRLPANGQPAGGGDFRAFTIEFARPQTRDAAVVLFLWDRPEVSAMKARLTEMRDHADSLEIAKGRFLASVSHELRTPLNAIIGFSDMLKNEMFGPYSDPRQKEYVELIGESGNHLLSVVNAILDVSKIESGTYLIEPEPFMFTDALDMCHSMMILQAKSRNIAISRDVDKAVGELCADRRAVQQILINLVSNAIKFTLEGGKVQISADVKNGRLRFRVTDNGIGISAEDLQRIGQPFVQVQNSYTRQFEGTGLGLSLVKGLVSLHEGEMMIDSAPGCGTTVTVSLPVAGPGNAGADDDTGAGKGHDHETGERTDEFALRQA